MQEIIRREEEKLGSEELTKEKQNMCTP
jgi:hypothetical protein